VGSGFVGWGARARSFLESLALVQVHDDEQSTFLCLVDGVLEGPFASLMNLCFAFEPRVNCPTSREFCSGKLLSLPYEAP
jgi:hypothetical protein